MTCQCDMTIDALHRGIDGLERDNDRLIHEVRQLRIAVQEADFKAVDLSQRIMAAVAVMDEIEDLQDSLTIHTIFIHIRAALKLKDD